MTDSDTGSWNDYYDEEAGSYDESRGGRDRARAAANAIDDLVSSRPDSGPTSGTSRGRCLDVAGGTGIVSAELAARGWTVAVADASHGMLTEAAERLPGHVVQALGDRLPVRDDSVELITIIWMLNLVPNELVDAILTDVARVLAPGGHLVATVDKELAHATTSSTDSDSEARITPSLAGLGLQPSGNATFSGRSIWGSVTDDDPTFRLAAYRKG